jgi:hypothetical protein
MLQKYVKAQWTLLCFLYSFHHKYFKLLPCDDKFNLDTSDAPSFGRNTFTVLMLSDSLVRRPIRFLYFTLIYSYNLFVTLPPKSGRTHDHILLSHLRLPQPGGPGLCIYIPQEQGGPVIPPAVGSLFCRLLRLRWRYSNPPPHGSLKNTGKSKSKLYYDRQSAGQSVLVSGTHLGPATEFFPFSNYF